MREFHFVLYVIITKRIFFWWLLLFVLVCGAVHSKLSDKCMVGSCCGVVFTVFLGFVNKTVGVHTFGVCNCTFWVGCIFGCCRLEGKKFVGEEVLFWFVVCLLAKTVTGVWFFVCTYVYCSKTIIQELSKPFFIIFIEEVV